MQRNGDAAPSVSVLIKGSRAPGEVSLQNCFRGAGGADAPVDSRALLFFVNDLCALTIEAARRHVRAFIACIEGSHAWSLPQFAIVGKAPFKLHVPDRQLVTDLALRAHVGLETASIGDLTFQGGVFAAALADLAASNVSPTAEACAARVRTELGIGRVGTATPFFTTVTGFVRELAALAAWLQAFDPTTTLAVPARSVEQEAWVFTQEDAPCGKILVMPGTCGIAAPGGVGVSYAPVGPVLVRRSADASMVPACFGSPVAALLPRDVLEREWATPSNAMESLSVLPVGVGVAAAGRGSYAAAASAAASQHAAYSSGAGIHVTSRPSGAYPGVSGTGGYGPGSTSSIGSGGTTLGASAPPGYGGTAAPVQSLPAGGARTPAAAPAYAPPPRQAEPPTWQQPEPPGHSAWQQQQQQVAAAAAGTAVWQQQQQAAAAAGGGAAWPGGHAAAAPAAEAAPPSSALASTVSDYL